MGFTSQNIKEILCCFWVLNTCKFRTPIDAWNDYTWVPINEFVSLLNLLQRLGAASTTESIHMYIIHTLEELDILDIYSHFFGRYRHFWQCRPDCTKSNLIIFYFTITIDEIRVSEMCWFIFHVQLLAVVSSDILCQFSSTVVCNMIIIH